MTGRGKGVKFGGVGSYKVNCLKINCWKSNAQKINLVWLVVVKGERLERLARIKQTKDAKKVKEEGFFYPSTSSKYWSKSIQTLKFRANPWASWTPSSMTSLNTSRLAYYNKHSTIKSREIQTVCVLGQFTRQQETNSCLDFATRNGWTFVVVIQRKAFEKSKWSLPVCELNFIKGNSDSLIIKWFTYTNWSTVGHKFPTLQVCNVAFFRFLAPRTWT